MDEDLGPVLVVAGTQGACHAIRILLRIVDAEPESITLGLMLLGVVLEVGPEMIGERVSLFRRRLEDVLDSWSTSRGSAGEHESTGDFSEDVPVEARDEDALAMLGNPAGRVDDGGMHLVSEFVGKRVLDHLPRLTLVVRAEVLDVLQQQDRRPLDLHDVADPEEKVPLALAAETIRLTERALL